MATEILMPALSPTMEEGTLARWLVKEGDTIMLVEAMKTFNPITAPKSGKIEQVLIDDASPVEFGEALFIIV